MPLLTEEQKRLMGIEPRDFGGMPAMFQPGAFQEMSAEELAEAKKKAKAKKKKAKAKGRKKTEGRRSLTLFPSTEAMVNALERANKLIQRVNATVNRERQGSSGTVMNEKARADMYRLDQELATAMDAVLSASDALECIERAKKAAAREARQARRQGRR
jgi:hypothetical protein